MIRKPAPAALPEVHCTEDGTRRYLHLGGTPWVQGSMRINRPFDLDLEYVQRMMAWLLFTRPAAVTQGHAVQLGLGAAALTKFCYKRLGMRTTAIEINPQVVAACRQWFKLPPDNERLRVLIADAASLDWGGRTENRGRTPISRSETRALTPILSPTPILSAHPIFRTHPITALQVDLYDHEAAAPVLDSAEFYAHCRAGLADNGVMTVNLFGRHASYTRSLGHIVAAFGAPSVWAFRPTREGNAVVLAQRTPEQPTRDELTQRADDVRMRWGLPAPKWLPVFKPLQA